MASPQSFPPYTDIRDCSQAFCSYSCPQLCYFLFPPPPPPSPSTPTLSPLLIAIVSMISTAFLLTAFYVVLTKFRRLHFRSSPPPLPLTSPTSSSESQGLDDTVISKIVSCRYNPHEGPVPDGTDCSVCLGRFRDGERLRLLPQCHHVFHVTCIDTWLRAHTTCPLCRGSVFAVEIGEEGDQFVGSTVDRGNGHP